MIITQTPLRISFLGGGTDYPEYFEKHGGAVLGTAVDKSAFFSMSQFYSKMFDYSIRIAYRKVECVQSIEELEHAPFRECLRWAGVSQDIEINHASELPAFTGLGSSSAFVVGLLNTLYAFRRRLVPRLDLAYEAIDLERNVLKESVGCQDQTLAAVGGFNLIEFRGMGNFAVHRVPFTSSRLEEFEEHLLVFFTGIKRKAEELAARQVRSVDRNRPLLKEMRRLVDRRLRAPFRRRQSCRLRRAACTGRGSSSGSSIRRSRTTFIDDMYRAGLEAGALGGKLLGAGGGGFLLLLRSSREAGCRRAAPCRVSARRFSRQRAGIADRPLRHRCSHAGAVSERREAV